MSINHRHIHFSVITIMKQNYCQEDWQPLLVSVLKVCWVGNLLEFLTDLQDGTKQESVLFFYHRQSRNDEFIQTMEETHFLTYPLRRF